VSTYTIGEVAARTGVPASTLRYYETIGLVEPVGRTDTGYRLYDDRSLARLSFVARAKQLGCSLDEINELVEAWAGDRCAPVQQRLHELVTTKITDVQHKTSELMAFGGQLQAAAAQLGGPPADGPCDADCACLATSVAEAVPVTHAADVAIACTLEGGPAAMEQRVAEWQALLAHVGSRVNVGRTLRLSFRTGVPLDELARLVAAEQGCCQFFAFAITIDGRGIGLEVQAPTGAEDVLASLFGTPA
jgi:DNA-binding transcriptional MerR regulator